MNTLKKYPLLIIGIFVLCLILASYFYLQYFANKTLALDNDQMIVIEPGMSFDEISDYLALNFPFRGQKVFEFLVYQRRLTEKFQAGEYLIPVGTSINSLLDMLIDGRHHYYRLTLLEGMQFSDVIGAVHSHQAIKQILTSTNEKEVMVAIGYPNIPTAEGMFLPETYYINRGTTDVDFLRRAYLSLQKILQQEWQNRSAALPYKTPYEALIMASIIEKETAASEERDQIAGVLVRRLKKGIKLQTDPSVIYAIGENYSGNIRKKDLLIDSAYNTYLHYGLPPTPIALASQASIHAALHPADGSALYFVSRGDGRHHFSDDLKTHNAAVRKYQLNQ